MPKAENRKKPPNMLGNVPGMGKRNRPDEVSNSPERQAVQDKKKDLLEKMKQLQARKKEQTERPE